MNTFNYWELFAGLGVFMFGMQLLEQSIKDLGGKSLRRIIRKYTNTKLKAIFNGTIITALLQSSSAVSLMVLAFVGAGIMSMQNAFGVILGSNIGTTLTAWVVATIGFKVKIEAFSLPFIAIGAVGLILFKPGMRLYYANRLLISFGLLFLGLDYMKSSVEDFSSHFDPVFFQNLDLWMILAIGALITALMQASAATIAITLTALNSQLMSFEMGAAMVIGANIGTTVTIILGAIGGTLTKKRVALSHLVFNLITGLIAFICLPALIFIVKLVVDISTDGLVGLAFFHTLFNVTGVLIFIPLISTMTQLLEKILPERKPVICMYLPNTPPEEVEAAGFALKKEIIHLFQRCQLYLVRSLRLNQRLVFKDVQPFEKNKKGKSASLKEMYATITLLASAILAYYSKMQINNNDEAMTREFDRLILASRNIMNSANNFKSIADSMESMESSDDLFLNYLYNGFKKRLTVALQELNDCFAMKGSGGKYNIVMNAFQEIEKSDTVFIDNVIKAASDNRIQADDLAELLLTNRLFTQGCRMMIYSLKDICLSEKNRAAFDIDAIAKNEIITVVAT